MQQKKLLLSIVFTIIVSSSLLGAYAVQITAPETPRGGDEAADGFINAAEESDGPRIQIIVNFTNSDQDANAGASIGDDVYLLNGTAGQQGISNFTVAIINTIDTTEFNQKSVNFTVTKTLLGGSDGPFEIHAQINNGTAGLISSAPGLVFTLDTALPSVTISSTSISTSDPILLTFTFSEAVTGFTIGDVTVSSGTKQNFVDTGDSTIFTMEVKSPLTGLTFTSSVASGVATDSAGNGNTASNQFSLGIAKKSGGGHVPNPPPSFTTAFSEGELPFLLNGNEIDISNFVNIVETTQLKTGEPVNITLLVYDTDGIDYVGLYTNLRGSERERYQSDTIIEWRNGQGLLIIDPNEYFEDANVNILEKGNKMEFSFDITFANPMEKSDLVLYVWDSKRNTVQTTILDAWEIIEESKPKTPFENEPETPTDDESDSTSSLTDVRTTIDDWSGFTENTASDSEMLQSIGLEGDYIPHWVKELGAWVHNGTIDPETLINAIQNLHEREIVL